MRKKIISLLCAAFIAVGLMPQMAFTASAAETAASNEAMLKKLGVLNGEKATLDTVINSLAGFMYDDPAEFGTAEEIAKSSGMIAQDADYNGTSAVLTEDAYKYAVIASGYEILAQKRGGYPDGYIGMAQELGISKSIGATVGKNITREALVNMLTNMLEVHPVVYTLTYNDEYTIDQDATLLSKNRKITKIKGLMTANKKTSLYSEFGTSKDSIVIEGIKYAVASDEYDDLIGLNVEAYVRETDDGYECLALKTVKNRTMTLAAEDIETVSSNYTKIEYKNDNDRIKEVKLANSIKVIYNGVFCGNYTATDLMPDIGSLELIDYNDDEKYEVIKVSSYKTMFVTSVDSTSKTIYSKFGFPGALASVSLYDLDEEDYKIYSGSVEVDITWIKAKSVLSVAQSKSTQNRYVEILISGADTLEGKYTGKSLDDDALRIDNSDYVASPDFEAYEATATNRLKIGNSYVFYFDTFGMLAYFETAADTNDYYVYLGVKYDVNKDLYTLRYLDMTGAELTTPFAKKVKIDEDNKEATDAYDAIAALDPQIVKLGFNSDGNLREFNTPTQLTGNNVKAADGSFSKTEEKEYRYWSQTTWLAGSGTYNMYLEPEAKIVVFPSTTSRKAKDYQIKPASTYLKYNTLYNVVGYDCDEFAYVPLVSLSETDAAKKNQMSTTPYIITGKILTINEDNEDIIEFSGNMGDFQNLTVRSKDMTMDNYEIGNIITMYIGEGSYASIPEPANWNQDPYLKTDLNNFAISARTDFTGENIPMTGVIELIDQEKERMTLLCGTLDTDGKTFLTGSRMSMDLPNSTIVTKYDPDSKTFETVTTEDLKVGDQLYMTASYGAVGFIIKINPKSN